MMLRERIHFQDYRIKQFVPRNYPDWACQRFVEVRIETVQSTVENEVNCFEQATAKLG